MNRFYNIWITVFFKRFSLKFSPIEAEYPDTAVINICSNVEYNRGQPIVYTSSTHLNIVGHEFTDESSEIIAKYATLPIGMFALRVCPHDPNKWVHREQIIRWIFLFYGNISFFYYRIAIAGNNKRINILDLSTLKRDNVEIQSLTSKIQGKVLALAWHPTNENLLSFSTNEGRVSFHMKIGAQTIITFQIKFRIEGWCLQHQ